MAHQQLNQPKAAGAALKEGTVLIQWQFPKPESGNLGREWPDWLIAHILLREATTLIAAR
jgi:hypothetical protein